MAWNTEETRARLLAAGATQFAAKGYAGARIQGIANEAGISAERVYQYFGNKHGLYEAVLADRLSRLLDDIAIDGEGPEALGAYAGALFDRFRESPETARLLAWESLEMDEAASADRRRKMCADKKRGIRRAMPWACDRVAGEVLFSVTSLVLAEWNLVRLSDVMRDAATRRHAVIAHATAIARSTQRD
ncbi:TetR family transcriptional regulator [Microbacterium amylolyticum]|uniref:AcrR family transcriptional regulator n=1 Tax=Microbacterium amylolyticum TaxID=936337 RepID=A0ABS4ZFR8_9MICO|nr:TetR family transcriptional regulator [Microbacterium amylolyticum]MBP2436114.1 AcrR family transcriptional regulator [Microbacterium amylolyticum]